MIHYEILSNFVSDTQSFSLNMENVMEGLSLVEEEKDGFVFNLYGGR